MKKKDLELLLKDCIILIVEILIHVFGFKITGEMRKLQELTYMSPFWCNDENLHDYFRENRITKLKGTTASE